MTTRHLLSAFTLALLCASLGARAAAAAPLCVGDCNGDGQVRVDELVLGVSIALGSAPLDACAAFGCGGDGAVTIACLIAGVNSALSGCASTARPTLSPLSGGSGAPFLAATAFDLAPHGYETAEYLVAGTASAFVNDGPLGADGRWAVTRGVEAAYRTRIVVFRPADPADFNGTVLIEWMNVSGGLDAAPDWISAHTELMRAGYAWVGVTAQQLGIEGGTAAVGVISLPLKEVDPARYGTLTHPGDSFSYDIFSQVARAVREPVGADPLAGLPVARVIGAGESQSAFRLVTYINAIHPGARLFDGYLVHSRGAIGAPLSEAPQTLIPVPGTAPIREDVGVPVLIFQTENDLTFLGYAAARQPDSTHVRLWEVAGTAHADTYTVAIGMTDQGDDPSVADLLVTATPLPGIIECPHPINAGPQHWVLKAAIAALDRWVRDGTAPAPAPRLELADGQPVALQRDALGNALGGIRTPQVDAPIATLSGDGQEGSILCLLFGTTVPFDRDTLLALYPDHAAYVAAFDAATDAAVAAGYILPPDAALMKASAAAADIPPQ